MSDKNKRIIQKAAITTATGGQLSPEQANRFISTVVDQSAFLKKIKVQPMSAATYHIDTLGIAARQMRKATEATDPGFTANVTFPRRSLETVEVILPYDISVNFLEENIAKQAADQQINQAFAAQFSNDLLDLSVNGDESSADAFIQINDGWVKLALNDSDVNLVDLTGLSTKKAILKALLAAFPNKYKTNPTQLAFLVSPSFEEDYREELSQRATAMGDAYLTENRRALYQGIEVFPVPFWPDGNPMLTAYSNLWIGIGRNISYDREKKPRKRIYEYTITAKTDANYAVSEMIAVGH